MRNFIDMPFDLISQDTLGKNAALENPKPFGAAAVYEGNTSLLSLHDDEASANAARDAQQAYFDVLYEGALEGDFVPSTETFIATYP